LTDLVFFAIFNELKFVKQTVTGIYRTFIMVQGKICNSNRELCIMTRWNISEIKRNAFMIMRCVNVLF